jgi:hypothetical protein
LATAVHSTAAHVRRIRLDNAEAILETNRVRVELDYQHARREVERLHLIVRLIGATEGRQG